MNDFQLILTSAVVSAVVSSSITLLGQYLERKSRESEAKITRDQRLRELFLTKALELTLEENKLFIELNKKSGGYLQPYIASVAEHFTYLTHIFEHGSLPEKLQLSLLEQNADIEVKALARKENARIHNDRLVEEAARHPLTARQLIAETSDKSVFTAEQYEKLLEAANSQYP
jgi:hypothetical protein